jgi:3',5'-cyclic AMP phosphodiesterase CpdA
LKSFLRPVYILPGNHDEKTVLMDIFGTMCPAENDTKPCICYTIGGFPAHLFIVDTTISHHHGGVLNDEVARWLETQLLNTQDDKPTLIFEHHPPFKSGITVMDTPFINIIVMNI